jgi:drug/metabolite transporter (DMT)-like permease
VEHAAPDRSTLAAFAVTVVLGALNGIAVKFSNQDLDPFWGAALRFGLASACFFGIVAARRIGLPRGRALIGSTLYGLLTFGVAFTLVYWGLVEAPAGPAVVILATTPLLTLLLAVLQGLEPFRWQGLVGAMIALAGIGVIFGDQLGADIPLPSMLAILGAAACFAETNVVIKRFPRIHPAANNATAMGIGALVLLGISIVTGSPVGLPGQPETWIALTYLVLVGSVVLFALFLYVIARWTASATSYQLLLMPLVGVPAAALLLGEAIRPTFLAGGAIVMMGVYLGAFAPSIARFVPVLTARQPTVAAGPAINQAGGPPDCEAGCP